MVVSPVGGGDEGFGLEEIETYISRRQNTVSQYIGTRPIFDLFLEVLQWMGKRVTRRWW